MPRWTLLLRTLARESSAGFVRCLTDRSTRRQCFSQQWRSYSIALQDVQRDDTTTIAPIALSKGSEYSQHSVADGAVRNDNTADVKPAPILTRKSTTRGSISSRPLAFRYRRRRLARVGKLRPNAHTLRGHVWWWRREKGHSRTPMKWVTARSSENDPSKYSSNWNRTFARITRHLDQGFPELYLKTPAVPSLDTRTFGWVEDTIDRLNNGLDVFEHDDSARAIERRDWIWKHVALWFLAYDPEGMIPFLRATHRQPYVPTTWVEDSLLHLGRHSLTLPEVERDIFIQDLGDLFCLLADRKSQRKLNLHNPFLRKVMKHGLVDTVHSMYQATKDHKVGTHWDTYLHFARYFAKRGRFEDGLDALLEARNAGAALNGLAFRSRCAILLRKSIEQPEGLRVCLHLVSNLVGIGVNLNQPICDIIMLNAVEAGDLKTAFSVYRSVMERGLQPKESTFAVLLQGCKLNIDDTDLLNETIRDAISNVAVRKSPLVATQILHCLALHHSKHHPDTALNTLTEAYAQLFDLQPLQKLNLPIPSVQDGIKSAEVMPPTRHAITFMIGASVQQILARTTRPSEVMPLYQRWRELVEANEPLIADLATTDHVSNLFLAAFIRHPRSLIHAARVVRDMQRPLPNPRNPNLVQCEPTVQTWSIFLHGFTRHGQTRLAEQVLTYMRSKGIEPNDVTWNTLITGYARAQDVERTVETVRRAEERGMVWDAWTHKGLRKLRNQERLREELRAKRMEKNLDFSDELKNGIGERLSGAVTDEPRSDVAEDVARNDEKDSVDGQSASEVYEGFADSPGDMAELSTESRGEI